MFEKTPQNVTKIRNNLLYSNSYFGKTQRIFIYKDSNSLLSNPKRLPEYVAEFLVAEFAYPVFSSGDSHFGKMFLALDHLIYSFLEGVLGDETVNHHVLVLADAVSSISGLCLHGRIPPKVEVNHMRGSGQVQSGPSGLQ